MPLAYSKQKMVKDLSTLFIQHIRRLTFERALSNARKLISQYNLKCSLHRKDVIGSFDFSKNMISQSIYMFEIKTNVFLPIQFEISSFTNTNRYIEREGNLYISMAYAVCQGNISLVKDYNIPSPRLSMLLRP